MVDPTAGDAEVAEVVGAEIVGADVVGAEVAGVEIAGAEVPHPARASAPESVTAAMSLVFMVSPSAVLLNRYASRGRRLRRPRHDATEGIPVPSGQESR